MQRALRKVLCAKRFLQTLCAKHFALHRLLCAECFAQRAVRKAFAYSTLCKALYARRLTLSPVRKARCATSLVQSPLRNARCTQHVAQDTLRTALRTKPFVQRHLRKERCAKNVVQRILHNAAQSHFRNAHPHEKVFVFKGFVQGSMKHPPFSVRRPTELSYPLPLTSCVKEHNTCSR